MFPPEISRLMEGPLGISSAHHHQTDSIICVIIVELQEHHQDSLPLTSDLLAVSRDASSSTSSSVREALSTKRPHTLIAISPRMHQRWTCRTVLLVLLAVQTASDFLFNKPPELFLLPLEGDAQQQMHIGQLETQRTPPVFSLTVCILQQINWFITMCSYFMYSIINMCISLGSRWGHVVQFFCSDRM